MIKFQSVVDLHYSISNLEGIEFESTFNSKPVKITIGDGTIPQKLEITLYDPVVPSGAQAVNEWVRLHHEAATGVDGYSSEYKKDITFNMLGPVGDKVEEWTLKGAFISEANFNDLSWSDEAVAEISLTLKYDYAILQY